MRSPIRSKTETRRGYRAKFSVGPSADSGLAKAHRWTIAYPTNVGTGGDRRNGNQLLRAAEGTATPVGITIRAAAAGGGTVAELSGPWLKRWDLGIERSQFQ
jgi:hypothetical protein